MTTLKSENEDDLEKLRMENELRKMKLRLEYGAEISETPGNNHIDIAMENKFLDYIDEFEKNCQNAESILLYDFLNRPDYIKVREIPDSKINAELDRIMKILNENGIELNALCEVDERELYRFITEELFLHKVDNMRVKGMMTCFIYEEFHPNHDYDIRRYSAEGVEAFLNKGDEFYAYHFTKEAEESSWFKGFRNAFESFSLKHFEITQLNFDEQKAKVTFVIDFTGFIEGSHEKHRFSGEGTLEFIYQYDYWYIQMINFPAAEN